MVLCYVGHPPWYFFPFLPQGHLEGPCILFSPLGGHLVLTPPPLSPLERHPWGYCTVFSWLERPIEGTASCFLHQNSTIVGPASRFIYWKGPFLSRYATIKHLQSLNLINNIRQRLQTGCQWSKIIGSDSVSPSSLPHHLHPVSGLLTQITETPPPKLLSWRQLCVLAADRRTSEAK